MHKTILPYGPIVGEKNPNENFFFILTPFSFVECDIERGAKREHKRF
jgi:hypothetical protein